MTQPDDRIAIQEAMRAAFPQAEARVATFYGMQEYHLGWRDEQLQQAHFDPGKLLRPYFVLLGCAVAGGDPQQALPLAAGVQLIHDFSLIHDDIFYWRRFQLILQKQCSLNWSMSTARISRTRASSFFPARTALIPSRTIASTLADDMRSTPQTAVRDLDIMSKS